MGEKYKSSFLSDKDTKSILEYISEIMVNHGWSFNINLKRRNSIIRLYAIYKFYKNFYYFFTALSIL